MHTFFFFNRPKDEISNVDDYSENTFEGIKHFDERGNEYWDARELQKALEYTEWRKFKGAIERAIESCKSSGITVSDHFVEAAKIVNTGSGGEKEIENYHLSRYACYLIVMNGDPRKDVIALGQTYFAVKTRQQEILENYQQMPDDEKRIMNRHEVKGHNKSLAAAAKDAGVKTSFDYANFQNAGYKGLYNGETAGDIKRRKGLKKNQQILDHMGSTELAANLFRITQTEEKLKNDHVDNKEDANRTHYVVGAKVRQTIKELGGTMPEDLPTPDKSVRQIEKEHKKRLPK